MKVSRVPSQVNYKEILCCEYPRLGHGGKEVKRNNFSYEAAIHGDELKKTKQMPSFNLIP